MKKAFLLILSAAIILLSACNPDTGAESGSAAVDPDTAVHGAAVEFGVSGGKYYSSASSTPGGYLDEDLLLSLYGDMGEVPDMEAVTAYCVYIDDADPTAPAEFGVFLLKDGADAEEFASFIKARINAMIENAVNYPSINTEGLTTAVFEVTDECIYYTAVIGHNADIAAYFEENVK